MRTVRLLPTWFFALAAAALLALPSAAFARNGAQYRIEGGGWGHGIGLSQYGARGYAERGMTGEQIIQHYFTGTVVAPRPAGVTLPRVLLRDGIATGRVTASQGGSVSQGAVSLPLAAGDVVEFKKVGANLEVTRISAGVRTLLAPTSALDATVTSIVDGELLTPFSYDAAPGRPFRGTITGHLVSSGVSLVNNVPFESYLRGVVPWEMPSSWHPEALKAQAIAARSYALKGLRTNTYFDLYADTRSQMYGGKKAEAATTDAAIAATNGMVARVGDALGPVAQTFFFSTSPGRTANNEDVWGSTPYSYLRSVASPYESASPYMTWTGKEVKLYTPAALARAIGSYGGRFKGVSLTLKPSGYVDKVTMRGSGKSGSVSGSSVQARLGLRSSYFRIVQLTITAYDSAPRNSRVRLSGFIPTSGVTQLVLRVDDKPMSTRTLKPAKSGKWVARATVRGTISARLVRNGINGPAITITPTG